MSHHRGFVVCEGDTSTLWKGEEVSRVKIRRCVKYKCGQMALLYLNKGETMQTKNGFLIAKIPGWYCPNCAGGYGR